MHRDASCETPLMTLMCSVFCVGVPGAAGAVVPGATPGAIGPAGIVPGGTGLPLVPAVKPGILYQSICLDLIAHIYRWVHCSLVGFHYKWSWRDAIGEPGKAFLRIKDPIGETDYELRLWASLPLKPVKWRVSLIVLLCSMFNPSAIWLPKFAPPARFRSACCFYKDCDVISCLFYS